VFTYEVDVYDDDLTVFGNDKSTEDDLRRQFAFISSEAKRHAEVATKNHAKEEKVLFDAAKCKELDQWLSNEVFSIVRKAGIPQEPIMSMRWVLTWKAIEA